MANTLTVVAGPPFGGKSRMIRERMAADPSLVLVDFTAVFAAISGEERDPETRRYPVRATGDPRLAYAAGVYTRAVEHAAFTEQRGFVTTAKRDQIDRLKELAATRWVEIVDPGEGVVRDRMAHYYGGAVPDECENAMSGWYGGRR